MDADEIARVLSEHFVMWHLNDPASRLAGGPTGEWRCACGKKFGFSDSAIVHQRDQLAPLVEQARQEGAREALRAAAEGLNSEGLDFKKGGWGSNPADIQTIDVMVKAVQWLRDRAERAATPGSGTAGGGT